MKKKVLIADDNSANQYLLKSLLESEGLEVILAENGKDALDKAHANLPDLIVSDILMPVMDGYALCRQLKSDNALKHIPLVFYTATYTGSQNEAFALSLGAERFIIKPQEPDLLMNILKELLEEGYVVKQIANRPLEEEMEVFRQYNEILFKKLEKKMSDLEIANQELKASEERYRLSFENVSDVIYTMSTDLNVLSISPSMERILGYKPQDFIGRPVSDLGYIFTPASFEQAVADISLILKGETIFARIYEFVAKDGTIKIGEVSGSPVVQEGKIVCMISVARDITDRKRAEDALISNYALLQIAGETAHFGGWSVDLGNNICTWSDAVADIHEAPRGYSPLVEEGINFYAPEWREKITKVFSACAKEGIPYDEDMMIITRKGKRVWVRTIGKAVRNEDGNIIKVQGSFQDITERKRAEEVMRALTSRQEAILAAVPEIIMEVDNNKVYTWANSGGIEFFGEDVIGKEAAFYFEGEQKTYDMVSPLFTGAEDIIYLESWQRRKDGEKRLLAWWCRVLKDESGQVTGVLSSARDITERKQAEEALRNSEERFKRLYQDSPIPTFTWKKKGDDFIFFDFNKAAK